MRLEIYHEHPGITRVRRHAADSRNGLQVRGDGLLQTARADAVNDLDLVEPSQECTADVSRHAIPWLVDRQAVQVERPVDALRRTLASRRRLFIWTAGPPSNLLGRRRPQVLLAHRGDHAADAHAIHASAEHGLAVHAP